MVYCGRPSKGCGACRARKVKCDQTRPACNRCLKANRSCPGYRDQLSLLFRDESSSVAQKAKSVSNNNKDGGAYTPPVQSDSFAVTQIQSTRPEFEDFGINVPDALFAVQSPDTEHVSEEDVEDAEDTTTLSLMPLSIDWRQHAICFSLSNFAWITGGLIRDCNTDADISPTASFSEKAMMKGILSVGMASIARIGGRSGHFSQSMKLRAQQEYHKALKFTNAAISHRTQAKEDATLAAILCLSLFEILTSKDPETVDSFIEHTKGAVALLELRGESQLFHKHTLQMFQFVRNEIIISCLIRFYRIPHALLILSEKATMLPDTSVVYMISHQTCLLMERLNELRIQEIHHEKETDTDPTFISRVFALDSEFEALVDRLPPLYAFDIHTAVPGQIFAHPDFQFRLSPFGKEYHTYKTSFTCMALNHLRYGRILTIVLILKHLRRLAAKPGFHPSPEFKNLCYQLRDTIRQPALDICATVPYLCGYIDVEKTPLVVSSAAGALGVLFPLLVAAGVDGYGSPMADWISDCFHMIGTEMGIDQALALRQIVPSEKGIVRFIDSLDT